MPYAEPVLDLERPEAASADRYRSKIVMPTTQLGWSPDSASIEESSEAVRDRLTMPIPMERVDDE